MPYREKIGWLSLIAMAVTFGPYFTRVQLTVSSGGPLPFFRQLSFFAATTVVQMVILVIGHLYRRAKFSEDARIPPDERDLAIMRRSVTAAYGVLIVGMILVGCIMPFNSHGWTIVNASLFMIIIAEMVHYGIVVLSYRRQS